MAGPHDITIDYSFFELALEYIQEPSERVFGQMAGSKAAEHLLAHSRAFGYDVPDDGSAAALVRQLLASAGGRDNVPSLRRALATARPGIDRKDWLRDALNYLPPSARLGGTLFVTYGYDCGVAYPPNASINLAFPWLCEHPHQAVYYCIHEVHHAGFFSLQPPPAPDGVKTCRDLLGLVQYLTHLEGMAVMAAYPPRRAGHALEDWSGDYEVLENPQRMRELASCYFDIYSSLGNRGDEECGAEDMAVLEVMSGGERLWYRVGCMMAQVIERKKGRVALNHLIEVGPAAFLQQYLELRRTD